MKSKPIDHMNPKQLEAYAARLLTDAAKAAAKLQRPARGRWQPSRATRAICNAGRGWYPDPRTLR